MYNTMNGVNVADKLGLGSEVRELKFGSSFTSGGRGQQQGSFHSVRYDFKPASVDTSKMATLDVGPNGQVTISMPNVDGNGTTVFKGARKPYAKECVLIIDNDTGEVVLEKLTHNIQVKRTREEGGSKKSSGAMSLPPAPPSSTEIKPPTKNQPPPQFKSDPKVNNNGGRDREEPKKSMPPTPMQHPSQQLSSKRGPSNSPKPPHQPPRKSPNSGPSPGHSTSSPPMSFSPAAGPSSSQESHRQVKGEPKQQPNLLSLTNFEDLLMPTMNPPPKPAIEKAQGRDIASMNPPIAKPPVAVPSKSVPSSALSESSSGEDSSSSSSSDDDDDDSSDMEEVLDKVPIPPAADIKPLPVLGGSSGGGRPQPPPPVALSMPTDLLCEDLQLSESGSDSD